MKNTKKGETVEKAYIYIYNYITIYKCTCLVLLLYDYLDYRLQKKKTYFPIIQVSSCWAARSHGWVDLYTDSNELNKREHAWRFTLSVKQDLIRDTCARWHVRPHACKQAA